jgi:hypothetical protein
MRTPERYKNRPLGLSPRQCGYVLNLAQGMSRRGAALAAGYSERVATMWRMPLKANGVDAFP